MAQHTHTVQASFSKASLADDAIGRLEALGSDVHDITVSREPHSGFLVTAEVEDRIIAEAKDILRVDQGIVEVDRQ